MNWSYIIVISPFHAKLLSYALIHLKSTKIVISLGIIKADVLVSTTYWKMTWNLCQRPHSMTVPTATNVTSLSNPTLRSDYFSWNFEAVLITLDSYYDLDTWWELTCHWTKLIVTSYIDHAHILFISEKMPLERLQNQGQFPSYWGLYFCNNQTTTVVTNQISLGIQKFLPTKWNYRFRKLAVSSDKNSRHSSFLHSSHSPVRFCMNLLEMVKLANAVNMDFLMWNCSR